MKSNTPFLFLSHGIFSIKKEEEETKADGFNSVAVRDHRGPVPTLGVGVLPKSLLY